MADKHVHRGVVAGWWRRFFSLWYEILLFVAVILLLQALGQALFQWISGLEVTALSSLAWARWLNFSWLAVFAFAYFALCWHRGQTLAMKTWRMRLAAQDGRQPSWRAVVIRFVTASLFYAPAVPLWVLAWHSREWRFFAWLATAWVAAPSIWAMIDRDRQLLHDRLAGTRLILTANKHRKHQQQPAKQ